MSETIKELRRSTLWAERGKRMCEACLREMPNGQVQLCLDGQSNCTTDTESAHRIVHRRVMALNHEFDHNRYPAAATEPEVMRFLHMVVGNVEYLNFPMGGPLMTWYRSNLARYPREPMDSAVYDTASPDDTLVMRASSVAEAENDEWQPIGLLRGLDLDLDAGILNLTRLMLDAPLLVSLQQRGTEPFEMAISFRTTTHRVLRDIRLEGCTAKLTRIHQVAGSNLVDEECTVFFDRWKMRVNDVEWSGSYRTRSRLLEQVGENVTTEITGMDP